MAYRLDPAPRGEGPAPAAPPAEGAEGAVAVPERAELHRLGMAEMGWRGLSEQWLMRRAGDLHWQLIAQAMGQGRAVFACPEGRPVYAAFCATSLRIAAPALPALGADLQIRARLWRASAARLVSEHRLAVGGVAVGRLTMVSAFVAHGADGRNRSILRRQPAGLPELPPAPPGPAAVVALAADLARGRRARHLGLPAAAPEGTMQDGPMALHTPCPATDFNAAGLLYFPSFLAMADRSEWQALGALARDWAVVARDTIYLGNLDPGERVAAQLVPGACGAAACRVEGGAHLVHLTREDGSPLARVFTRKQGLTA